MSSYRDDTDLATALRELCPTPRAEFAAELDARVAAGFPRRSAGSSSAIGRTLARLRATPPRRLLLPAGGLAVTAIVVATAVVSVSENGGGPAASATKPAHSRAPSAGSASSAVPETRTLNGPAKSAANGDTGEAAAETSSGAAEFEAEASSTVPAHRTGPYASRHSSRAIERGASITLGAEPSEVRGDAGKVFEAVHAANGIVLRSTIRDGSSGDAGADFELLIPAARLSDALAAFSGIAEVRSRHESSADITAPTVSAQERLQDSNARVQSLLAQLAGAESDAERAEAEVELQAERRHAASLRSQLSNLDRRANLSHVSLRIETGASSAGNGGGGAWGIGDGFGDAGRILAIAAGVTVIGLAILAPFAAIFLLGWLARRAWLRHARAGALA